MLIFQRHVRPSSMDDQPLPRGNEQTARVRAVVTEYIASLKVSRYTYIGTSTFVATPMDTARREAYAARRNLGGRVSCCVSGRCSHPGD
jgi:hypothetical protein